MDSLQALIEQQKAIDELLQEASDLLKLRRDSLYDSDRVDYSFVGEAFFVQGDSNARDVVFTVPDSSDFVAERFAIYPFYRVVNQDEATFGPDEESYRPCVLASFESAYAFGLESDASSMDLYVSLAETFTAGTQPVNRSYQNIPTPAQLLFSGAVNYRPGYNDGVVSSQERTYYDGFQFPTSLLFACPYLLPRGSSVTVKLAPLFAGLRYDPAAPDAVPEVQNQYKVAVVLEGYKKVRR